MLLDFTREPIFIDPGSCPDGLLAVVSKGGPTAIPYGVLLPEEAHHKLSPLGKPLKPSDSLGTSKEACPVYELRPSSTAPAKSTFAMEEEKFIVISSNGRTVAEDEPGYWFWQVRLFRNISGTWGCSIRCQDFGDLAFRMHLPKGPISFKMHLPDYNPNFKLDMEDRRYATIWDRISDPET